MRSVEGGATSEAKSENATTPILTPLGCFLMKSRTADLVASMRSGFTSSASIDPETSSDRMIVPVFWGSAPSPSGAPGR